MKFLKKLKLLYCLMFVILANCQTVDEVGKVMRNERKLTDEFLVKKINHL